MLRRATKDKFYQYFSGMMNRHVGDDCSSFVGENVIEEMAFVRRPQSRAIVTFENSSSRSTDLPSSSAYPKFKRGARVSEMAMPKKDFDPAERRAEPRKISDAPVTTKAAAGAIAAVALAAIGSFASPQGAEALSKLLSTVAWPAVTVFALIVLRPEIMKVLGRISEFDAFGVKAKIREELKRSEEEVEVLGGRFKEPTPRQLERAAEVKEIAGNSRELVLDQVEQLAREYENTRSAMKPGDRRTRRLEIITSKMRTIGLAAFPFRYEIAASPSPGKRLQAIACLQVRPDFDMLLWLVEQLGSEQPFIAYHAAVALNVAALAPDARDHSLALAKASEQSDKYVGRFGPDTDRAEQLNQFKVNVRALSAAPAPQSRA